MDDEIGKMKTTLVRDNVNCKKWTKQKALLLFEDMSVMSQPTALRSYEVLGNADWMNDELGKYVAVTTEARNKGRKAGEYQEGEPGTIYYFGELIIVTLRKYSSNETKEKLSRLLGQCLKISLRDIDVLLERLVILDKIEQGGKILKKEKFLMKRDG